MKNRLFELWLAELWLAELWLAALWLAELWLAALWLAALWLAERRHDDTTTTKILSNPGPMSNVPRDKITREGLPHSDIRIYRPNKIINSYIYIYIYIYICIYIYI